MSKSINYSIYHSSGIISTIVENSRLQYLDQFSEEQIFVTCKGFPKYLKNKYNLTSEQYYNIIVRNNNQIAPKCHKCHNEVEFVSIVKGYREYCSGSCRMTNTNLEILSNNVLYLEAKSKCAKIRITRMNKLRDKKFKYNFHKKSFISHTKNFPDNCIFYISINSDNFKCGVSKSLEHAQIRTNIANGLVNRYFISSNINVANHEYLMKMKFENINEIFNISLLKEIVLLTLNNSNLSEICINKNLINV